MHDVVAILQARMGSSRLPGKVLMPVMGKPLLWYQVERIRLCAGIREVVLATTTNTEDDSLEEFGRQNQLAVYRGAESDVLDRYRQAAKVHGGEYVMRLTGDCPLIDPIVCQRLIDEFCNRSVDYASTGQTYAEGLDCEIMKRQALETAWLQAVDIAHREHVTLFIREHEELFSHYTMENVRNDGSYRITVDEPADFEVVRLALEALWPKYGADFSFLSVLDFLDMTPHVKSLNAEIVRNEALVLRKG